MIFWASACSVCGRGRVSTWSCLKSHKAWTMTGLLLFSSGFRGLSLTMVLDLLTRLWTCLLFSMIRSFSFCNNAKDKKKKKNSICVPTLEVYTDQKPSWFTTHVVHIPQPCHSTEQIASSSGVVFCSPLWHIGIPGGRTSDLIGGRDETWSQKEPKK